MACMGARADHATRRTLGPPPSRTKIKPTTSGGNHDNPTIRGRLRRVSGVRARHPICGCAGARSHHQGQEDPHHGGVDLAAVRHPRQGQQADRLGGRDRAATCQGPRRRAGARAGDRAATHPGAVVGPRRSGDLLALDHHRSREVGVVLESARRALDRHRRDEEREHQERRRPRRQEDRHDARNAGGTGGAAGRAARHQHRVLRRALGDAAGAACPVRSMRSAAPRS